MKAKKITLWFCDAIVFIAIAIYRSIVGYTDDHYISLSDSWFSDVYYVGSSHTTVYDEPFFIVCMVIMVLYLLVALFTKVRGTDEDGVFVLKVIAYIAAVVSVTFMYSGEYDCIVIALIGIISVLLENKLEKKQKTK